MRIALVAGEASGDMLAADLLRALKHQLGSANFFGIGGPRMQREGFDAWWQSESLAVHGYVDALRHYKEIAAIRRNLLRRLLLDKPDVFVGVDAPDFNLWLERQLKQAGVRTVHYVSPSVWAWRSGRIKTISRSADHLLTLFPFEKALYDGQDISVTYVGHPLGDSLSLVPDRVGARERLGIGPDERVMALLPGSRQTEVACHAGTLIQTADLLAKRFADTKFLVPLATRETREIFQSRLSLHDESHSNITMLFGHARDALSACDVALVASGTATLEAALLKVPMVVYYRLPTLSWAIMSRLRLQPWVGLPNILAGRFVVPEFLQDNATPENLAQAAGNLMADRMTRTRLTALFRNIHVQLKQGAAERAAQVIIGRSFN